MNRVYKKQSQRLLVGCYGKVKWPLLMKRVLRIGPAVCFDSLLKIFLKMMDEANAI